MEFRLFGEVQLRAAGHLLDIGPPRQQGVLAALAVDAGRPVPIETLIDRVWDDAPPAEARNVVYSHLSRIRQLLSRASRLTGAAARIDRRYAGYVLAVDPDCVDLHRFIRLVEQGRNTACPDHDRAAALTAALDLWRGSPLAGVTGRWAEEVRGRWHRRRLDAVVQWGELRLALGGAEEVIDALRDLVAEYPLAEPLEGLLMRALHLAGRDAEAIERYAAVRERLADELGADPAPELRALHVAILRGELPSADHAGLVTTPAQLPPDVPAFAGREQALRQLDGVVGAGVRTARIVVVSGTAGVGKTALTVHWAHRVRGEFPDGQLYVNLRGFDPTGSPVPAAAAVRSFLDTFEVPPRRIPASLEAQIGLYRSLLANRRVLVVLDNARDAEQVRPLLPGSPSCLVLLTSRDQLSGLITEGAYPLTLDLLDAREARALLAGRLGADRLAAEPRAVDQIVQLCARLPLALAVVAARAASHPQFGLAALAEELRAARGSLDPFAGADPATDPRAVFSWSYLQLSAGAGRLFRLLGLHTGPDLGTRAAASLAGMPIAVARPLLAELARAHLVTEHIPGRYVCHDLLRAYAREQGHALDSATERRAATRRVLLHYVHSANHADRLLDPRREDPPTLTELPSGVAPDRLADQAQALAWFDTERRVLLSAIHQGIEFDAIVWELVWATRRFLAHQGFWHDEIDVLMVALAAARRLADPLRQAYAHCYLGTTYIWFGKYQDARANLDLALALYRDAGHLVGQAYVELYHSWVLEQQRHSAEALPHAERALVLFRTAGHQAGQAKALNAIGWYHALSGAHLDAVKHCNEALALQTRLGDQIGAGHTWHSLGYAHDGLGDHPQATICYRTALALFRAAGYRIHEAQVLMSLGDTHRNTGDLPAAHDAWQAAYGILQQLGHPDAAQAQARLAEAGGEQRSGQTSEGH